jgi:Holliday junction resolvasome RuvABC endonuclease subunit
MLIPVAGFDPSLTNWGIAEGQLDLETGYLNGVRLEVVSTDKGKHKQVRTNSDDLRRCEELARKALEVGRRCKAIFVEVPVGSQNASGMKAYGVVCGILGTLRAEGIQIIEVTATEVKLAFTGNKNATKQQMIDAGVEFYPTVEWPRHAKNGAKFKKGDLMNEAEHVADALAAIHAGVSTPIFQNLLRILR